ncbi:hypothetical protein VC159_00755 [Polynucleobacter sp. JS-JIR-II-c23]|uniref:hypothetical protein n=1 Tax=Polynucleobacter sp. JS-JIR-II-c23 TaxID=1758393 RepID=UPI002B231E31|nr:hypothetical protein [Polynucleobacter sp. JS-JIR-II-c23]MEA9602976.1 hypothetical protein [Polynucleobacter sp. JS-JIR-II-c23]
MFYAIQINANVDWDKVCISGERIGRSFSGLYRIRAHAKDMISTGNILLAFNNPNNQYGDQ